MVENNEQSSQQSPEQAAEGQTSPVSQSPPETAERASEAGAAPAPAESAPPVGQAPAGGEVEKTASEEEASTAGIGQAEQPAVPEHQPIIRGKIDKQGVAIGTGRRKTAVARVRITEGAGSLSINGRRLDDYFRLERDRQAIEAPLRATDYYGKVDVWVRVDGGGTTGQTGAIVLGIARALEARDPSLHHVLHDGGFLTRDDRMVERKKYGYKKARKSFQFSKR